MTPTTTCSKCGNLVFIESEKSETECPFCALPHTLTVAPEDPRYLVFLDLVERERVRAPANRIHEFKPTARELVTLNPGDHLCHGDKIWRIAAKADQNEPDFFDSPRMWISWRETGRVEQRRGRNFLTAFPPFISNAAMGARSLFSLYPHSHFRVIPLSVRDGHIVAAGDQSNPIDSEHFRLPAHRQYDSLEFWSCSTDEFERAWQLYQRNLPIRHCGLDPNYLCPQILIDKEKTDGQGIRFCQACQQNVYIATGTSELALYHGKPHCEVRSEEFY